MVAVMGGGGVGSPSSPAIKTPDIPDFGKSMSSGAQAGTAKRVGASQEASNYAQAKKLEAEANNIDARTITEGHAAIQQEHLGAKTMAEAFGQSRRNDLLLLEYNRAKMLHRMHGQGDPDYDMMRRKEIYGPLGNLAGGALATGARALPWILGGAAGGALGAARLSRALGPKLKAAIRNMYKGKAPMPKSGKKRVVGDGTLPGLRNAPKDNARKRKQSKRKSRR